MGRYLIFNWKSSSRKWHSIHMTFVYIRYMWHLNTFDTCVVCIHMIHSIHMTFVYIRYMCRLYTFDTCVVCIPMIHSIQRWGGRGPCHRWARIATRRRGLSTVWPDLAKFWHLDEFKSLWQLLMVNHLPFGKILILLTLAIAYVIWQIFTGVNWQKLKKQSSQPATLT